MPLLQNPKHEAFAQARAKGTYLEDAYEIAGFRPGRGHASRLAARADVAERIAELRAAHHLASDASIVTVINTLLRMVEDSEALATPAGLKERRLTLLKAMKLGFRLQLRRSNDRENHYDQ